MEMQRVMSRRSFVAAATVTAAAFGMAAMTGCAPTSEQSAPVGGSSASAPQYDNTLSPEVEELNVLVNSKDTKIACISMALQKGYYDEEKLHVATQSFAGGFPEAMPALSKGTADVLPFGSIPACTYISQGDDLVIFGGTVMNGSECVTLIENKDKYKTADDFRGTTIGCFRMETGHMVLKSWLRKQGLTIGNGGEADKDVNFQLLESSAAEVAAVENGELDMCFVNSGYGYVAEQGGRCAVAFRPNELIGREFPCCRQTTNRTAFEQKRSALIKFEIANLRALCDIHADKEGTIAVMTELSGQTPDYVEGTMYGTDSYTAAMKFEMDPMTDDVKEFYADMVDNGDLENTDKDAILGHLDSTIYKAALDVLLERGENKDFYEGLLAEYEAHNTLGL